MTIAIDCVLGMSITLTALIGLLLTFSLLRIVNLSHGEIIAVGAYSASFTSSLGASLFIQCVAGVLASSLLALGLEATIIRKFYGRHPSLSLLGTWGISIAIVQCLRLCFGPAGRFVPTTVEGSITFAGSEYPVYRSLVLVTSLILLVALALFIKSRRGLEIRAAIESPGLAESFGIDTSWSFKWTFVAGSAVAGLAGVLLAPMVAVHPAMGSEYTTMGFLAILVAGQCGIRGGIVSCVVLSATRTIISSLVDANTATICIYLLALSIIVGSSLLAPGRRKKLITWDG
jgi:urea transport system permease protein